MQELDTAPAQVNKPIKDAVCRRSDQEEGNLKMEPRLYLRGTMTSIKPVAAEPIGRVPAGAELERAVSTHADMPAAASAMGLPDTTARAVVIIPTYNEAENLVPLVNAILRVDGTLDVIVVDDDSPDGTGALADRLAAETGRVQVLHRAGKQGLGTAYIAGFRHALDQGYEWIVEMDADFSHRPEDLPRLLQVAKTADVVIGSRNVPGGQVIGWSALRHAISKGGSLYARGLLGLPVHDCTGGFKCFRRAALGALDLQKVRSSGYGFQVEVNYACARTGLHIVEVPIVFPDRLRGQSKMSLRIVAEAALVVLRLLLGLTPPAVRGAAAESGAAMARGEA